MEYPIVPAYNLFPLLAPCVPLYITRYYGVGTHCLRSIVTRNNAAPWFNQHFYSVGQQSRIHSVKTKWKFSIRRKCSGMFVKLESGYQEVFCNLRVSVSKLPILQILIPTSGWFEPLKQNNRFIPTHMNMYWYTWQLYWGIVMFWKIVTGAPFNSGAPNFNQRRALI
jgi:hypothetical protein